MNMQPHNIDEYKYLLTELLKKQILILGPDITLAKARNVQGLTVDNTGKVTEIIGQPEAITQNLIDQFIQLSGLIMKKTMESMLTQHSEQTSPEINTSLPARYASQNQAGGPDPSIAQQEINKLLRQN